MFELSYSFVNLPVAFKELGGVVTDVTKTLDDYRGILDLAAEACALLDFGVTQEFADTLQTGYKLGGAKRSISISFSFLFKKETYIVNTQTGGFSSSTYTTLSEGLACDTTSCIDVIGVKLTIGIHDPGHLFWAGANIGSRDIYAGTDEALLAQFHGITTSDSFQLVQSISLGVDFDTALGTAD